MQSRVIYTNLHNSPKPDCSVSLKKEARHWMQGFNELLLHAFPVH